MPPSGTPTLVSTATTAGQAVAVPQKASSRIPYKNSPASTVTDPGLFSIAASTRGLVTSWRTLLGKGSSRTTVLVSGLKISVRPLTWLCPPSTGSVRVAIARLGAAGITTIEVIVVLNAVSGTGVTGAGRRPWASAGGNTTPQSVARVTCSGGHWPASGMN